MRPEDREYLLQVYEFMCDGRVHQARWLLSQFLGILDPDFGPTKPNEPEVA